MWTISNKTCSIELRLVDFLPKLCIINVVSRIASTNKMRFLLLLKMSTSLKAFRRPTPEDVSFSVEHETLGRLTLHCIDGVEKKNAWKLEALEMLNDVIEEGLTWPPEIPLDEEEFENYFMVGSSFVLVAERDGAAVGCFYVKPNFIGRSSHICNGGFIVRKDLRGKGLAQIMGGIFLKTARQMGYVGVMFNLVYATNVASQKVWEKLGFKCIGVLPKAARLKGHDKLVDAKMYFYDLEEK